MTISRNCNRAFALLLGLFLLLIPAQIQAQNWLISGYILDSAGGPVEGVDLDLIDPDSPNSEIPVSGDSTASDGSFSMTISITIPAGTYSLQVNPPAGFLSSVLDIDLTGDLDVGNINLGNGWIITGLVEDIFGNPLSPIDIDIRGGNSGWLYLTGDYTLADGTFCLTIPGLVDEYRFHYQMVSPSPAAYPLEVDDVFLFGDTDLGTIVMDPAHTLTGTVVDEDGVPLPGIDMNIYDAQGVAIDLNNDNTDNAGNFSVLVPQGTWDVVHRQVTSTNNEERIPHGFLELTIDKNLDLGTIVMPLGFHVFGQVIGSSGEAIVDANLDAEQAATEIAIYLNHDVSNPDGAFDILLPAGSMNVEVDPPPTGPVRQPQLIEVEVTSPGPIDLGTVVLPDAELLSGRCIDSAGNPIPFVDVELLVSATGASYPTIHENGGSDGTFSVALSPNTYDLMLLPPSTTPLAPLLIEQIEVLTDIDLGDLTLPAGSSAAFIRGDANQDLTIDISDPIMVLDYLFGSTLVLPCEDAADGNDDGDLNIADAIKVLQYLFGSGSAPPTPFPDPNFDTTPDNLGC